MSRFFFPFAGILLAGRIIRRYKRFLADVVIESGREEVVHVPNSGSMATCWHEGARVILSRHPEKSSRKHSCTLQAVEMPDGWIGVNTMNPNRATAGALLAGAVEGFADYSFLQTEVKTTLGSRFDVCLRDKIDDGPHESLCLNSERAVALTNMVPGALRCRPPAVIEIKNATMRCAGNGVIFPDSVTIRGQKHLSHLIELRKRGYRAVMLFFAGRNNTEWVGPASEIDPEYYRLLKSAFKAGVEIVALRVEVSETGLTIDGTLPVIID